MTNHPVVPPAEGLAARTAFSRKRKPSRSNGTRAAAVLLLGRQLNGAIVHMNRRDTTMVAISRQFQESGSRDVRTRRLQ